MAQRIDPAIARLAAEISRLKRDIAAISRVPQLDRSSLDNSGINVYDDEGRISARVGRQHDGAYTSRSLSGPKPATPAGVTAEGGAASVTAGWDGSFVTGATPTDFGVVEVWAAQTDFTAISEARLLGHFADEDGGEVTGRLPVGDWYVALVCRSQSGRRSDVSERVLVTVESVVDPAAVDALEQNLQQAEQDITTAEGNIADAKQRLDTAFGPGGTVPDVGQKLDETITSSVVEYAVGGSMSNPPTTGWSTTSPVRDPGEYIWYRTVVTYGDTTTTTSSAALLTGNQGEQGPQGIPGVDGEDGTSVTILGSLPSEGDLPASGNPGDAYLINGDLYVWTGSAWENIGRIQGPQGVAGPPGEDGQSLYVWVKYGDDAQGSGITDDPTGKSWIGLSYDNTSQLESSNPADYTWAKIQGDAGADGADGADGVSVAEVRSFYRHATSTPAQPTVQNPSGWFDTEPPRSPGESLYRTERILYDNGTFAWTPVTLDTSYNLADEAMDLAESRAPKIIRGDGSTTFTGVLAWQSGGRDVSTNLVVSTPITNQSWMSTLSLKGYNYAGSTNDLDGKINFYAFAGGAGDPRFVNTGFTNQGSMPATARLGWNTDGTVAVILTSETANGLWDYPMLAIPAATFRGSPPDSWLQGWSVQAMTEAELLGSGITDITTASLYDAGKKAEDAQATADLALASANGKNHIYRDTSQPSGDGEHQGDVWWQYADTTWTRVVGEWVWDGSTWVEQQREHQTIASVDLGALTVAGQATLADVVAQEIAARSGQFIDLDVEQLVVTGTSTVDSLVAQEIWAEKINAQQVQASEIATETLAVDSGFIGVLNSAEIVGAIIKTAESGQRVVLDSANGIRVHNDADEIVLSADVNGNLETVGEQGTVTISTDGIVLSSDYGGAFVRSWSTGGEARSADVYGGEIFIHTVSYYGGTSSVEVYDGDGVLQRAFPIGNESYVEYVGQIAVDDGTVYVLASQPHPDPDVILEYDVQGNLLRSSTLPALPGVHLRFDVSDSRVYVSYDQGSNPTELVTYDLNWNELHRRQIPTNLIIYVEDGLVYTRASQAVGGLEVHDTAGNHVATWPIGRFVDAVVVSGGMVYCTLPGEINVLDSQGNVQAVWSTAPARVMDIVALGNTIYDVAAVRVGAYSIGATSERGSFSTATGRLTALGAVLRGTTEADAVLTRRIMPNQFDPNEEPRVVVDHAAFPNGANSFASEQERDSWLPLPPDGTRATTGGGSELKEWKRQNGQWQSERETLSGDDVFDSLEPGLSFFAGTPPAAALTRMPDGSMTCTLTFGITGLNLSNGEQSTAIGTLASRLTPSGTAQPMPGYRTNGAIIGAITGSGSVSVRWSSAAATNACFFSATYVIAG